jgi:hypothetical protein
MKNHYPCGDSHRHLLHSPRLFTALLGLASLATSAVATPTIYNWVDAYAIVDGNEALRISTNSSSSIQADGSVLRQKGCTGTASGSSAPGGDCFIFDPAEVPPPTTWYQRPHTYTYAAAQGLTSYGVNKARSWSIGSTIPFDPEDSSTIDYFGEVQSGYIEEISYFGAAPTLVTFKLHLHGAWNDGGRFRLAMGSGVDEDPDAAARYTLNNGVIYTNCPPEVPCIRNGIEPNPSSSLVYVAGSDAANTNGTVDQFIDFTMLLHGGINPFLVDLHILSSYAGAEMDAFSTVTLDSITVQPGVSLSFGSGTDYNVQFAGDPPPPPPTSVPEPGAPLLMLTGLAALLGTRGGAKAKRQAAQHRKPGHH